MFDQDWALILLISKNLKVGINTVLPDAITNVMNTEVIQITCYYHPLLSLSSFVLHATWQYLTLSLIGVVLIPGRFHF